MVSQWVGCVLKVEYKSYAQPETALPLPKGWLRAGGPMAAANDAPLELIGAGALVYVLP